MSPPSASVLALAFVISLAACSTDDFVNVDNAGEPPPFAELHFPVAVGLSPPGADGASDRLFVVNSDFNVRYNAGTVQVYDLDAIAAFLDACRQPILIPDAFIQAEALIPPYATGLAVREDGERLYIPTRSEGALVVVDVSPPQDATPGPDAGGPGADGGASNLCTYDFAVPPLDLECGGRGDRPRCRGEHVITEGTITTDDGERRGISLPSDPIGVVTSTLAELEAPSDEDEPRPGHFVLVAHRFGELSLLVETGGELPELVDVANGFADELTQVAWDPPSGLFYLTQAGNQNAPIIGRAGVALRGESGLRSFLYDAGNLLLQGYGGGNDTRDITFSAVADPPDLGRGFIVARSPDALLRVDVEREVEEVDLLPVRRVTEVGPSAARLTLGRVGERLFAFVSTIGGRELYIVDAELGQVASVVRGFSGPFTMALDTARERLYVADFGSSVVRIVDLASLRPDVEGSPGIVATLGLPRPVSELQ